MNIASKIEDTIRYSSLFNTMLKTLDFSDTYQVRQDAADGTLRKLRICFGSINNHAQNNCHTYKFLDEN